MKRILVASILGFLTSVTPAGMAFGQGEILTFDDLPSAFLPIPNGYGGLQWENLDYVDGANRLRSGYMNSWLSWPNVAYNGYGNSESAMFSDGLFNFNSGYLTAAWNNGLQVEVKGSLSGSLLYDHTYTVNTTGPTFVNFDYLGVDRVSFISFGGTPYGGYEGAGTEFAMDNLSVTLVPEPCTLALAGLGGSTLLIFRKRLQGVLASPSPVDCNLWD